MLITVCILFYHACIILRFVLVCVYIILYTLGFTMCVLFYIVINMSEILYVEYDRIYIRILQYIVSYL